MFRISHADAGADSAAPSSVTQTQLPSRLLIGGLVVGCAVLLAPLAPAVMLAIWLSIPARGLQRIVIRVLGGHASIAAGVAVVLLATAIVPVVVIGASLAVDAYEFVKQLAESPRGKELLAAVVSDRDHTTVPSLLLSQPERIWSVIGDVAGTASRFVVSLVVIALGTFSLLVDGVRWYRWIENHAGIPPALLARLREAFFETGRGLFIGIGGAGLLQASLATVMYLVLGVPRAFELGFLTFCASIIPMVGTALVWAPIAAGLAIAGHYGAAIALTILGLGVISTIDNIVRPLLARRAHLALPTYVVLVAMFSGVLAIGPWGLLVAPLVVRLSKAALEYRSEVTGDGTPVAGPNDDGERS